MSEEKITYDDVKAYESLFTSTPSLILKGMVRSNANLVGKFESKIKAQLDNMDETQQKKLQIILDADITDLQEVMKVAYKESGKKQYKILSEPNSAPFIEKNLGEIKKLL